MHWLWHALYGNKYGHALHASMLETGPRGPTLRLLRMHLVASYRVIVNAWS
jgi:hypothetical protein